MVRDDPKVSFLDSQIRSSVATKVQIQGAHSWMIRSSVFVLSCFLGMLQVLGLKGQIPLFWLCRREKTSQIREV